MGRGPCAPTSVLESGVWRLAGASAWGAGLQRCRRRCVACASAHRCSLSWEGTCVRVSFLETSRLVLFLGWLAVKLVLLLLKYPTALGHRCRRTPFQCSGFLLCHGLSQPHLLRLLLFPAPGGGPGDSTGRVEGCCVLASVTLTDWLSFWLPCCPWASDHWTLGLLGPS